MSLTLVILAAGRGSRFGGDKPLAEVGPNGQSLFEYSIYDAVEAGFTHVIFVVNAEQNTSEYTDRLTRFNDKLSIEFVVQSLSAGVKDGQYNRAENKRMKPWGTGHALLVCRGKIHNSFVVINADDYYGRSNFKVVGDYLLEKQLDQKACTLPGYRLANTLSDAGGVNRGICTASSDGYLEAIQEVKNIRLDSDLSYQTDKLESDLDINNDSLVSMTFWGFQPSIFDVLEMAFESFLQETADLVNDEFYIPQAINLAIESGEIKVKVFPTSEKWKGVTYAGDVGEVRDFIIELTDAGYYPA